MATTFTQTHILGAAIIGLLNGELTDETIAAVDTLKRADMPEPFNNMVGFMHGMRTHPLLREGIITSLLVEIRGAATKVLETRYKHPNPLSGDWIVMYGILEAVLEGGDRDLRAEADLCAEAGLESPRIDHIPAWARPLVQHINNSTTQAIN